MGCWGHSLGWLCMPLGVLANRCDLRLRLGFRVAGIAGKVLVLGSSGPLKR
jgi:hypothetical protein